MTSTPKEVEEFQEEFSELIYAINKMPLEHLPELEERNKESEDLIELHFEVTGEIPKPLDLKRLGDYVLADDLKNKDNTKNNDQEYPLQTKYSKRRTPQRELSVSADILDYLHSKYHKRLDTLSRVSRADQGED